MLIRNSLEPLLGRWLEETDRSPPMRANSPWGRGPTTACITKASSLASVELEDMDSYRYRYLMFAVQGEAEGRQRRKAVRLLHYRLLRDRAFADWHEVTCAH